ncbi:MAG: TolC family protein [Clostridium sp.]|nr:TolC family protein [Clostridium sp.]
MSLMNDKKWKRLWLAGMAAVLSAGLPLTAMAEPEPAPGGDYQQYMERLTDNRIEYDELADLIKNFYGPLKSQYDSLDSMKGDTSDIAMQMRVRADDLVNDEDDLKDQKKDNPQLAPVLNQYIAETRAGIKELRKQAKKVEDNLDKFDSGAKAIDRYVNEAAQGLEYLMNNYQQTLSSRELVAKSVEVSQAAWNLQQTMQAQGLAVDSDILSAASQLASSKQQLAGLDSGLEQMRRSIYQLTGYDVNAADVEIGLVPHADPAAIAAIDVAADKEKAALNNYDLIAMRSGSKSQGLSAVEKQTVKTTTMTRNKIRNVEYSEDQVRSNVQTLYDTILQKKAEYDSASTAWQSAQITWNAAQVQRQGGLLSDIQFMQMELAYLQAKSGYECADLALQQAMRDYQWAVKGVTVTAAA